SFFQAEDGIRAFHVTGVQTCALPISFVLFTSYAQLRYAADTLRDLLERHGLSLWVHGEATRLQLLTGFKETAGSVPFGTDSFWRSEERRVGKEGGTRRSPAQRTRLET